MCLNFYLRLFQFFQLLYFGGRSRLRREMIECFLCLFLLKSLLRYLRVLQFFESFFISFSSNGVLSTQLNFLMGRNWEVNVSVEEFSG